MALVCLALLIFCSCFCCHNFANAGDPVAYFPPFELRAVSGDNVPFMVPLAEPQFQPARQGPMQSGRQQRLLHTTQHIPPPMQPLEDHDHMDNVLPVTTEKPQRENNSTVDVHELLHALGIDENGHEDKDHSRAAARDYDYPPSPGYAGYSPYSHPPSYGYQQRPSYAPNYPSSSPYPSYGPPPPYHEQPSYHQPPPSAYTPPLEAHHSAPSSKLKLVEIPDLVKPLASKVAGKVSGLIGLVLTLLTGSTGDVELKGFKDIVINGIVKPLLIAKGGLKSLISKLAIPVISLLLINLEVLITVWWLWEDCPEPVHAHAAYPAYPRPGYGY